MAIPYPDYFTALDRTRVDQAITAAEPPRVDPPAPRPGDALVVVGSFRGSFASDPAAIAAVQQVLEVVVRAWRRHPAHAGELPAIEALLDWLIAEWAEPRRAAPRSSLDVFDGAVRAALDACVWWTAASRPELTPAPSNDTRPPLSVTDAAKQLGFSPKTIRRRIETGEIHAVRIGRRGHLRVPQAEVDRLKQLLKYQYRK